MFFRAVLSWLLIAALETLQGAIRELVVEPVLGALAAARIGLMFGLVLIFVIAWLTSDWIGPRSARSRLAVGALWVALTLAFEIGLGRWLGYSWARIAADYDPAQGGLMAYGLLVMLFVPLSVDLVRDARQALRSASEARRLRRLRTAFRADGG